MPAAVMASCGGIGLIGKEQSHSVCNEHSVQSVDPSRLRMTSYSFGGCDLTHHFVSFAPPLTGERWQKKGSILERMWPLGRLSVWDEATRRGAVRLLGGGGMAALLSRFAADAEAKNKHKKNKKKKKKATCNTSGGQFATQFSLSRSQAATGAGCLAAASGTVKIFKLGFAERMEVSITGLPPNTEFDLFVIQVPNAPFGTSWYQG